MGWFCALEVRFTSPNADVEASPVAILVTGLREDGLVEGRYLGTAHEELGKNCVNLINRRGLPIHLCRDVPCSH